MGRLWIKEPSEVPKCLGRREETQFALDSCAAVGLEEKNPKLESPDLTLKKWGKKLPKIMVGHWPIFEGSWRLQEHIGFRREGDTQLKPAVIVQVISLQATLRLA